MIGTLLAPNLNPKSAEASPVTLRISTDTETRFVSFQDYASQEQRAHEEYQLSIDTVSVLPVLPC